MAITVAKLHKELSKLIEQNCGRMRVCVDKDSFRYNLEDDGVVILDVASAAVECIPIMDGTGRTFTALVLDGGNSTC